MKKIRFLLEMLNDPHRTRGLRVAHPSSIEHDASIQTEHWEYKLPSFSQSRELTKN